MTDPQLNDLNNRIRQLEASNRRWKRHAQSAWIGLGLVVLSMMVMIAVMAQQSVRSHDEVLQMYRDADAAREAAQQAVEAAKEQARRALDALEKAHKDDPDKR
jgi:hypothetical protein